MAAGSETDLLPWLQELPRDWEVVQARRHFRERKKAGFEDRPLLSVTQDKGVVTREESELRVWNPGADISGYKLVLPGDFVISLRSFQGGFERAEIEGLVSPAYTPFYSTTLTDSQLEFLRHYFKSQQFVSSLQPLTSGIRQGKNISFADFGESPLPIPPARAARSIASFLDRETCRIDTLIEKKRRLLDLLEERRTALITRAVTQGLEPDVPVKESGVGWIGEIPEHWEVVKLRYLCRITTGERDTQDAEENGEYPFVVRSDTLERISTYSFDGEGVLTSGDGAGVGKIFHHMNGKFDYHQRVYLFYGFKRVAGRYLYHFLRYNLRKVVLAVSAKSTVDSLRRPMLLDFPVATPPVQEQHEIVARIDEVERSIDTTRRKVISAVALLNEYRTAIISAAVTGKIDIRDKAPA